PVWLPAHRERGLAGGPWLPRSAPPALAPRTAGPAQRPGGSPAPGSPLTLQPSWTPACSPAAPCHARHARHRGTRGPAVLADVLVPRPPDPGFEFDSRVLVQRGQLGPPGLADQQPLTIIEDRQQRLVHRCPPSPARRPGLIKPSRTPARPNQQEVTTPAWSRRPGERRDHHTPAARDSPGRGPAWCRRAPVPSRIQRPAPVPEAPRPAAAPGTFSVS